MSKLLKFNIASQIHSYCHMCYGWFLRKAKVLRHKCQIQIYIVKYTYIVRICHFVPLIFQQRTKILKHYTLKQQQQSKYKKNVELIKVKNVFTTKGQVHRIH